MSADRSRLAGVLVPLFSAPSTESWGIGEFGDIPALARWLHRAGFGMLQLLPVHETDRREASPYSALTAMALDPQFISLRDVPDFAAAGGEAAMDAALRHRVAQARQSPRVEYEQVRAAKAQALRLAFERFVDEEWTAQSARARELQRYVEAQSWWMDAYALFRAVRAAERDRAWTDWPEGLRTVHPDALAAARVDLEREVLFCQYVQWVAEGQWQAARRAAAPVAVFGDFPFLVTLDSADVWMRQDEFLLDASVGSPPDEFSDTGQDWGLPPCNWAVMAARGDAWLRQRVLRMAALFDGYRVDHLVGFYRTYVRPRSGPAHFLPADEAEQTAQGERLMRIFLESGPRITAEDLGVVPKFVRASLARIGLPGYRVLRWERDWELPGQRFRNPADYPPTSVATTGTHDTSSLATWWESLTAEERADLAGFATAHVSGGAEPGTGDPLQPVFDETVRDALLDLIYGAGSDLLVLPIQDLFGWQERINQPGTLGPANWTFKLPWPVDRLDEEPEPAARAQHLRTLSVRSRRAQGLV